MYRSDKHFESSRETRSVKAGSRTSGRRIMSLIDDPTHASLPSLPPYAHTHTHLSRAPSHPLADSLIVMPVLTIRCMWASMWAVCAMAWSYGCCFSKRSYYHHSLSATDSMTIIKTFTVRWSVGCPVASWCLTLETTNRHFFLYILSVWLCMAILIWFSRFTSLDSRFNASLPIHTLLKDRGSIPGSIALVVILCIL